jgi:hypothetical protein
MKRLAECDTMGFRGFSFPDELYFLCMLHNIGATSSDRSLTLEEISRWTALEPEKARSNLRKLIDGNYVQMNTINGVERYSTTVDGIRKVLSMYS